MSVTAEAEERRWSRLNSREEPRVGELLIPSLLSLSSLPRLGPADAAKLAREELPLEVANSHRSLKSPADQSWGQQTGSLACDWSILVT